VERIDKYLLGVDSSVDNVKLDIFTGKLTLSGILLSNPEGYDSPYLLAAKELHIDIDMEEYFRSRLYHLSIERLLLTDVQVYHEHGKEGRTNTRDVMQYLTEGDGSDAVAAAASTTDTKETWQDWICRDVRVSLHEFKVQDLVVKLHHLGPLHTVDCSDIYYKDYEAEVGDSVIDDLALFVVRTILKTAVSDVAKHIFHIANFTKAITTSAERIKDACPPMFSSCMCGVCKSCSGRVPRSESLTSTDRRQRD
jgi:hypothetical protein